MYNLIFHRRSLIVSACLTIPLFAAFLQFPYAAQAVSPLTAETETDAVYERFMTQSKEQFLISLSALDQERADPENFFIAAQALYQRTDFTQAEYIALATAPSHGLGLRQAAIECYAKKLTSSEIDPAILTLISDPESPSSLRTISINQLRDHFDAQNPVQRAAILSAAKDPDEALAYNAMKTLAKLSPADAVPLAQDIYDSFKDASPSRIHIASQILAQHYASPQFYKRDHEKVRRFVQQSLEIYNTTSDNEVKRAIPQALEHLSSVYTKKYDLLDSVLKDTSRTADFEYIGVYQHALALSDQVALLCMGGKQFYPLLLI